MEWCVKLIGILYFIHFMWGFYLHFRWNELWLNEGFASYMSYIGANHVRAGLIICCRILFHQKLLLKFEPNYRLCQQFVINEIQSVMGVDGLSTSHPINQPVHHPDEINQIFDRISYNKGTRTTFRWNFKKINTKFVIQSERCIDRPDVG